MSSITENKITGSQGIDLLASNLRYLMTKHSIDASKLYELTGIAATTINNLRRGSGNPTFTTLQSLGEYFGISVGQLTETDLTITESAQQPTVIVPLVELSDIDDFLASPSARNKHIAIGLDQNSKENSFAIRLANNSMAPFFEKGTVFVIHKAMVAQDGDLVLVKFGNNPACFRKIFIEDEAYYFSHVSELISKELYKSKVFNIYGVVIKAIQNFHD